jgi:hypothetical protein
VTGTEVIMFRIAAVIVALTSLGGAAVWGWRMMKLAVHLGELVDVARTHLMPNEHGESLPGNVSRMAMAAEATAGEMAAIRQEIGPLTGRVETLEDWRARHDPGGGAIHP